MKIAFSDIRKLYDTQGNLLPIHMLPDEIAGAVSSASVSTSNNQTIPDQSFSASKIKLWDKRAALELLGKHLGLLTTKVELTGQNGSPVKVSEDSPEEREQRLKRIKQYSLILEKINSSKMTRPTSP